MKYEQVWEAVDKLAKINGLSPSGLAKKAGLDATTFNKSKRTRPDGKKRWPSLDSLNKIIEVCNISFDEFLLWPATKTKTKSFTPFRILNVRACLKAKRQSASTSEKTNGSGYAFPTGMTISMHWISTPISLLRFIATAHC